MKISNNIFKGTVLLMLLSLSTFIYAAQSVTQLRNGYGNSKTTWNAGTGVLTFTSSGTIKLSGRGQLDWLWEVPTEVKKIVINANVRVNGGFHFNHTMTIEGKNRKTSVIFGTNEKNWADNRGIKAFTIAQIHCKKGVGTLKNFTILNPRAFHVLGNGGKCHISRCDFIDTRGGGGNHSDGYAGGGGSTIDNCYFETGDDVIKVYEDITVTNTHIHMVQNSVPIQLGWGNTGNNTGTFKNLTITGNSGRGNDSRAIIVARAGKYTKTINIDGCNINNPNAAWASLRESGQILKGTVKNANISIQKYWGFNKGTSNMVICGTTQKKNNYNCSGGGGGNPVPFGNITKLKATASNYNNVKLTWEAMDADKFIIRRKQSGGKFTNLKTVNAPATSYTDNTAKANTTYIYQVRPQKGSTKKNSNKPQIKTPACAKAALSAIDAKVGVYPIPAQTEINVNITGVDWANISLVNMTGQVVYTTKTTHGNNTINVEGLETGIYHVLINASNNISEVKRILIE